MFVDISGDIGFFRNKYARAVGLISQELVTSSAEAFKLELRRHNVL
jgi:hypothetical protein